MTGALTTVAEEAGKDRVKLRVQVPEKALDPALTAVYRRWARDIKVPGFRKGRVPRQLIDARVGPEAVREEALREALPDFYRQALESEELEAIAPPEVEVIEFEAGSPLVFEALVDVRPDVVIPDFGLIEIEAPSAEVNDDDISEQLERMRDRYAELDTVGRDARSGDFALIDINGYLNGELIEDASAPDFLYEIGSRSGPSKLDGELEGTRPGAIVKFNDILPEGEGDLGGREVSFTVLVKEIKTKRLPDLDDEFAKTVGEFDTLDDLKNDLRTRLASVKEGIVEEQIRALALEPLVDASDLDPPEKLVESEMNHRMEHFQEDLKRAGMSMAEYETASDSTELQVRSEMRSQAARSVRAELLLEEVARQEKVDVTQEDVGREVAVAAARAQRDAAELARQLVDSGRLNTVAADIMRRKALDHVVASVTVIGKAVDEGSDDE